MKKNTKTISYENYIVVDTRNITSLDDIEKEFLFAKLSKLLNKYEGNALAEIMVNSVVDSLFRGANALYRTDDGKVLRMQIHGVVPENKPKKVGIFTKIKNWFKKLFKREATR